MTVNPGSSVSAAMVGEAAAVDEPGGNTRGFSLLRFALMLLAVAIAHFVTAVAFGHSVMDALENLGEDAVLLIAVVSVSAWVRSRMPWRKQS